MDYQEHIGPGSIKPIGGRSPRRERLEALRASITRCRSLLMMNIAFVFPFCDEDEDVDPCSCVADWDDDEDSDSCLADWDEEWSGESTSSRIVHCTTVEDEALEHDDGWLRVKISPSKWCEFPSLSFSVISSSSISVSDPFIVQSLF